LYAKYIPPFVNSRMHSRTIFTSNSECFSSVVAGGGAVAASIEPRTADGSLSESSIKLANSVESCIGDSVDSVCGAGDEGIVVRLDSLVQKDKREASTLATGADVGESDIDVFEDASDGDGDGGRRSLVANCAVEGERTLTSSVSANCTRGPAAESASAVVAASGISTMESKVFEGSRDGRETVVLREASVFNAILAASYSRGIEVTPVSP
jgi:hypothetical protein